MEEYEDARDVSGHKDCSTKPCQVIIIITKVTITITIITVVTIIIVIIIFIILRVEEPAKRMMGPSPATAQMAEGAGFVKTGICTQIKPRSHL